MEIKKGATPVQYLRTGPRAKVSRNVSKFKISLIFQLVFHNSADVIVAIVTCGGICPGLNAVIREIVLVILPPPSLLPISLHPQIPIDKNSLTYFLLVSLVCIWCKEDIRGQIWLRRVFQTRLDASDS